MVRAQKVGARRERITGSASNTRSMRARLVGSATPVFRSPYLNARETLPWICHGCHARGSTPRRAYTTPRQSGQKPFYITTPIFYVNAGMFNRIELRIV